MELKFDKLCQSIIAQQAEFEFNMKHRDIIIQGNSLGDFFDGGAQLIGGPFKALGSLAKGDLKAAGQETLKTLASPVQILGSVAKMPGDAVDGIADMVSKNDGKPSNDVTANVAKKVTPDMIKQASSTNAAIKAKLAKMKSDRQKQILVAQILRLRAAQQALQKQQAQGGKKEGGADAKAGADGKGGANADGLLKDEHAKMMEIFIEAAKGEYDDDEEKTKKAFLKRYRKGTGAIFIFNSDAGQKKSIKIAKFDADPQKYIDLANKWAGNEELEDKDEAKSIGDLKEVMIPCIMKEKGYQQKVAQKRWKALVSRSQKVYCYGKDGKLTAMPIKDFEADWQNILDIATKKAQEFGVADKKAAEDAEAKKKADADKAAADKAAAKENLKKEAFQLCDQLPAMELAKLSDGNGDNDLKPPKGIKLHGINKKVIATWENDFEIDSKDRIQKWANFLKTAANEENPGHPKSIAIVLKKTLDSGDELNVNWGRMGKCKELYQEWIKKAIALAKKFDEAEKAEEKK